MDLLDWRGNPHKDELGVMPGDLILNDDGLYRWAPNGNGKGGLQFLTNNAAALGEAQMYLDDCGNTLADVLIAVSEMEPKLPAYIFRLAIQAETEARNELILTLTEAQARIKSAIEMLQYQYGRNQAILDKYLNGGNTNERNDDDG